MPRQYLSAFIIARNEADRIGRAIDSAASCADEVVVVDSGSEDDTLAVAEAYGARALFHAWPGYGPQKAFAETQCQHDWLLNIDADEEVSAELAAEIRAALADGPPQPSAFEMRWKMIHYGGDAPHPLAPAKSFIRLYDRRRAGFRPSLVHDSVVVREGDVARLGGLVRHRSFRSLAHFRDKLNAYADLQALDMAERGRRPSAMRTLLEPVAAFAKLYLLRRYFLYGGDGVAMAKAYAGARTRRLVKARAMAGAAGDGAAL